MSAPALASPASWSVERFRLAWEHHPGRQTLLASLALHVALLAPLLRSGPPASLGSRHLREVTWQSVPLWYVAPSLRPRRVVVFQPPLGSSPARQRAPLTIVFQPARPTNRWQTLIEPEAPPEPPRLLPPTPNVLSWAAPSPAPPLREPPRAERLQRSAASVPLPAIPAGRFAPLPLRMAAPVAPVALEPAHARPPTASGSPPPTLPRVGLSQPSPLIALSNFPGSAPPPLGQAAAPVALGPRPSPEAPVVIALPPAMPGPFDSSAWVVLAAAGEPLPPPPPKPAPAVPTANPATPSAPMAVLLSRPLPPVGASVPLPSERPVGTLVVNMPNLTSAWGSWILKFIELADEPERAGPLEPPDPVRKVDPKYPAYLEAAGTEGEVVLDAVIERDGSVRQIRVLRGVDPELDHCAVEAFAQWRFRPGRRAGRAIELEVVAYIPFRAARRHRRF